PNDLKNLISSQNNLKYLSLKRKYGFLDWSDIMSSLTKHSNTLIKLKLCVNTNYRKEQLSFINRFTNLRELVLSLFDRVSFNELNNRLQYITFPQLQILKFPQAYPEDDTLVKFLE